MKRHVLYTILASIFFIPIISTAQIIPSGLTDELNLNISPKFPKAGQNISASLEMYSENIDTAYIAWFLDGRPTQEGRGEKRFTFTAPPAGRNSTLRVLVTLANGVSFEKSQSVYSSNLNILWEANSYTPPFYKGKALFPPQGKVRVLALTDQSGLVYKWTVNGKVWPELGGYNKNTAVINGPVLGKGLKIEIEAVNSITGFTSQESVFITPVNPTIIFYENNPLYGIVFNRSLNNISLKDEEVNIIAVPYNASKESLNSISYLWKVNGTRAAAEGRSAVFRKPENGSGRSSVSLSIENPRKPLQFGEGLFSINFER